MMLSYILGSSKRCLFVDDDDALLYELASRLRGLLFADDDDDDI